MCQDLLRSIHLVERNLYWFTPTHIALRKYLQLISTLGCIQSVVNGDGFLRIKINDKLAGYLSLGKTIVVTGWMGFFSFSNYALLNISNGTLISNTATVGICDGFLVFF